MVDLGKDVKLIEYEHFPHGFLNYDVPVVGMPQVDTAIQQIVEWMKRGMCTIKF